MIAHTGSIADRSYTSLCPALLPPKLFQIFPGNQQTINLALEVCKQTHPSFPIAAASGTQHIAILNGGETIRTFHSQCFLVYLCERGKNDRWPRSRQGFAARGDRTRQNHVGRKIVGFLVWKMTAVGLWDSF